MSHKETTIYLIPKNIDAKPTLWKLNIRGWIIFSITFLFALLFTFVGSPSLSLLVKKFLGSALVVFLVWLTVSDDKILDLIYRFRYHQKNARILRWESEPNVYLRKIQED